jgi:23S rRNA (uracil1939-C5)-methyltransferase
MVKFRGHHLICLHFFKGEGYSPEFVNRLRELLEIAEREGVEVVDGPDDLCLGCPHLSETGCAYKDGAEEEIRKQDEIALNFLGLGAGEKAVWNDIKLKVLSAPRHWFSSFCRGCDWKELCDSIRGRRRKGDEILLRIERASYGSSGIGRTEDGMVVFVPLAVPGDLARCRIRKVRRSYLEADIMELEEPSKLRVIPRCRHFPECGGCTWQHVDYKAQIQMKESIVADLVEHIGGIRRKGLLRPIIGMEDPWFYRNKMEFSFKGPEILGLHRRGAFDSIVRIEECWLQSPESNRILEAVRKFVEERAIPIYDEKRFTGILRHLVIREGKNTGERMVNIVTAPGEFDWIGDISDVIINSAPVTSLYWTTNHHVSDAVRIGKTTLIHGSPFIRERIEGLSYRIGLATFFQTNTKGAEILCKLVSEMADLKGNELVFDLYCGIGTFAIYLSKMASHVVGVEILPEAVADAWENAKENGVENISFVEGDVGKSIKDLVERHGVPEVVVVDPPRSGMAPKALRRLAEIGPKRIIYVSCNPASLSRDLGMLEGMGYEVEEIQPVDLFPHTYHVECVARIEKVEV